MVRGLPVAIRHEGEFDVIPHADVPCAAARSAASPRSLVAAAFLLLPIHAAAAPAASDVGGSWSLAWSGVVEWVASWFGWRRLRRVATTAGSQSDLGSTLDPDGKRLAPDPVGSTNQITVEPPQGKLGSTLDPDG